MKNGFEEGAIDWKNWMKSKDSAIVQDNFNIAASAAFSVITNCTS